MTEQAEPDLIDLNELSRLLQTNPELDVKRFLYPIINDEKREHLDLVLQYQPDILSKITIDPSA